MPTSVDMAKLNFYPPNYEKTLNEMKLRKDKKYRDSLYLSMEEFVEDENGESLFNNKCMVCHSLKKNSTGPNLFNVRQKWNKNVKIPNLLNEYIRNWVEATSKDKYVEKVNAQTPIAHNNFPDLNDSKINEIFDYIDGHSDTIVSESKKETVDKIISENNGGTVDKIHQGNLVFKDSQGNDWNFKVTKIDEFDIEIEIEADIKLNLIFYDGKDRHIEVKSTAKARPSKLYSIINNELDFTENVKKGLEKHKKTLDVKRMSNISTLLNFDIKYEVWVPGDARKYYYTVNDIKILVDKDYSNIEADNNSTESKNIPPSKVLAFWKPQFNNTNLATREFEKRMVFIHKTCNNKVLEVYTKNLDKSLSECDKIVVKMGYPEFEEFSNENLAIVNPTNPHLKNLSEFYEKVSSDLRKEFKDLQHIRLQKESEYDENVKNVRNESDKRNSLRSAKNQSEEIELNMESVYKQLGKKRPGYRTLSKSVGFTITSNAAIHNIDRFVRQQTTKRETGIFYDKDTKKTAKLSYEKMEIQVANHSTYERIYVYLFPNKLSSFQRISGSLGKFSYSLNQEFVYDIAIVAFKNDGYYFYAKKFIKGENMGSVSLEKVSEEKLDASLQQLNSSFGTKKEEISSEIKWILKEQENYVVQKNRRDMNAFRRKIYGVVFPCGGGGEAIDYEGVVEPDIEIKPK